jgi:hypothetical protein
MIAHYNGNVMTVKKLLGHKRIENDMKYIGVVVTNLVARASGCRDYCFSLLSGDFLQVKRDDLRCVPVLAKSELVH